MKHCNWIHTNRCLYELIAVGTAYTRTMKTQARPNLCMREEMGTSTTPNWGAICKWWLIRERRNQYCLILYHFTRSESSESPHSVWQNKLVLFEIFMQKQSALIKSTPSLLPSNFSSQLLLLIFEGHWVQLDLCECMEWDYQTGTWVSLLGWVSEEIRFSLLQQPSLAVAPQIVLRCQKLFPDPGWSFGWLEPVQVLCMQSELLWGCVCSAFVISENTFLTDDYYLWLLQSFHTLSHDDLWAWVESLIPMSPLQSFLSVHWSIVGLYINFQLL